MKNALLLYGISLLSSIALIGQSNPNGLLLRSTIGSTGPSSIRNNNLQQSIGQASVIGTFSKNELTLRQGFLQAQSTNNTVDQSTEGISGQVYPNPFSYQLVLAFDQTINTEIQLELYNVVGELVYTNRYDQNQEIDILLDHLPSAEYVLKVIANQNVFVSKLTKY